MNLRHKKRISRRGFLRAAVIGSAGLASAPQIIRAETLGMAGGVAACDRIGMGFIGVGSMGGGHVRSFCGLPDVRIRAICDVYRQHREGAAGYVNEKYGSTDCTAYNDFNDMLERDDIDAVLVATPDHWHVPAALAAVKAGKAVYLEKPMGLSFREDRLLREAVRRYGAVFQFGTQQRSSHDFRFACELVLNGYIGELREIIVWCHGNPGGGSAKLAPVPEGLDYDRWLGQAPEIPFTEGRNNHDIWFHVSDYALGNITSWGAHMLDIALWGMGDKLSRTVEIQGQGTFPTGEGVRDTHISWDVNCVFQNGIKLNFFGGPINQMSYDNLRKRYGRTTFHGTAFEGTKGWVHVDRDGINADPPSLLTVKIGANEVQLMQSTDHRRNFLDAVRTKSRTICPIDSAVQADLLCHLSDIATKVNGKLVWDFERECFSDNDLANRLLARAMRSPYEI